MWCLLSRRQQINGHMTHGMELLLMATFGDEEPLMTKLASLSLHQLHSSYFIICNCELYSLVDRLESLAFWRLWKLFWMQTTSHEEQSTSHLAMMKRYLAKFTCTLRKVLIHTCAGVRKKWCSKNCESIREARHQTGICSWWRHKFLSFQFELYQEYWQENFTIFKGGSITEGMIEGVTKPVAVIGIAEKGFVTLKLNVTGPGGHSSMPDSGAIWSRSKIVLTL